jgi:hypothetical protein
VQLGRLQPAGAVARPGHSRPELWRSRYVAWEVAVDRGRGVAGRGRAATWHGRPGPDCGSSWPVAKPSTKVLNAKEKHKFVCSLVVRVV